MRTRHERGVTLVEMVVALLVLGVGVFGAVSLFSASSETANGARNRSVADEIVESELELMRSLPYADVGIATSDSSYRPAFDGQPTVTEGGANRVDAFSTEERSGIEFGIRRDVTWATVDAPSGRIDKAYKLLTVTVQWLDHIGKHEIQAESARYELDPSS